MTARVTVSIVSHGHGELIRALLADLNRQEASSLDVIVTLNVPEPAPEPTDYPAISLRIRRNESPLGFGANHNAALREVTTPWSIILNPDIRLPDAALVATLVRKDAGPRTGLRAPVIVNVVGAREDSVRANLDPVSLFARFLRARLGRRRASEAKRGRFIWLAGMFLCIPTEVFKQVGGFDERFFLYCEDYDLSARIVRAGRDLEIYEEVAAIHDARRSSHTSARYLRMHLQSLVRVWLSSTFWIIWAKDLRAAAAQLLRR